MGDLSVVHVGLKSLCSRLVSFQVKIMSRFPNELWERMKELKWKFSSEESNDSLPSSTLPYLLVSKGIENSNKLRLIDRSSIKKGKG